MPPAELVNFLRRAGWRPLCSPPRSWTATSCAWTYPCALTTWRSRKRSRSRRRWSGGGGAQRDQLCLWLDWPPPSWTKKTHNPESSTLRWFSQRKHRISLKLCFLWSICQYIICYQPLASALCSPYEACTWLQRPLLKNNESSPLEAVSSNEWNTKKNKISKFVATVVAWL